MSSLELIAKETQKFIDDSYKKVADYEELRTDLNEKVKNGLKGNVEARNALDNKKSDLQDTLYSQGDKLKEKIDQFRKSELKKIEETSDPITSDVVSELNLLSQLDLSSEDVNEYINKYKRSPLALRKLQDIAHDKKIFNQFPPSRKEYLGTVLGRMENHISRFQHPDFTQNSIKTEIIKDGVLNSIDEDVSVYNSLW